MNTKLLTPTDLDASPVAPDFSGVFPTLIDAYRNRSYDAGYARGLGDARIALLESVQEFRRLQEGSTAEVRRLVEAFSDLVEQKIRSNAPALDCSCIDGLGI
jgi:hypothetical protein